MDARALEVDEDGYMIEPKEHKFDELEDGDGNLMLVAAGHDVPFEVFKGHAISSWGAEEAEQLNEPYNTYGVWKGEKFATYDEPTEGSKPYTVCKAGC